MLDKKSLILAFTSFALIWNTVLAQEQIIPKPISWKDVPSWKSIPSNSVQLSPNGQWLVYVLAPVEGDSQLILQKSDSPDSKKTFAIGASTAPMMAFSEDSKWLVFKEYPKDRDKKTASKNGGKQLPEKLILIDLNDIDKKTEIDKVQAFAFNGEKSTHLAISLTKEGNGEAKGTDFLLLHLNSGKKQHFGNVAEYAFNKSGDYLAYTTDAANKIGNGIQLLHVPTGKIQLIDDGDAAFKSINWTEKGDALTALKLVKNKEYKEELGIVIGIKNLSNPQVTIVDPKKDSLRFDQKYTISPNRKPNWSEDLTRLFYGMHPLTKVAKPQGEPQPVNKDSIAQVELAKLKSDTTIKSLEDLEKAIARVQKAKPGDNNSQLTKPDMAIWHWKDARLQSRQQILENQDKNHSLLAMYDITSARHMMLQDSSIKEINVLPKEHYALGVDRRAYELDINLDGQTFHDFYLIDLKSGERKLILEKHYLPSYASYPRPSQDGLKLIFGDDGDFHIMDLQRMTTTNITAGLPTNFIVEDDDHNVIKPLNSPLGWSKDSKFVLLRDNWDIWQIPVGSKEKAQNLTQNGANQKIRYQYRFVLDQEEKGIDLSQPQWFRTYGEKTKKSGIVRLEPGKNGLTAGAKSLVWDDVNYSRLIKAKSAPVFLMSKEKFNEPTQYFLTDGQMRDPKQVTSNAPEAEKFLWSSGVRLVDYVSDKGDSLQGALFLPSGYVAGQKYPTIVYYYEKLSQTLHSYSSPGFSGTGWNPNVYTSQGYAVFVPDIVYTLDDPGMSAVWCVLPGVKAAIQTGIIDEKHIGLHGHSWGGYQTSFLITQTDMFKAAAAGAPLTNMISMYDLIYWNTGGGNMAIFEASQGRFRGGPWENWEAYERNSPVYHVKNVNTPLLMLHNDKDGAVDFTQGIEYYSALRRLKKPVIMIQYKGENHGLAKLENRKDYSVRMMEFFDFHLKGKAAPDWITSGIEKLVLEKHLEERVF
jgi:dipeptidyl aminopeptidase/acylaminoacyl peptidase